MMMMMMMMIMMMMRNYFCGMVDLRKTLQPFSLSQTGFEPAQSLSLKFSERSYIDHYITAPQYLKNIF